MKRCLALAALLMLATPAPASDAYVDEVLKALERKGLLSAQEVRDIKVNAREADRRAQAAAPPTTATPPPAAVELTIFTLFPESFSARRSISSKF